MMFDRANKPSARISLQRTAQAGPVRGDTDRLKAASHLPRLQQAVGNRGLLGMLRGVDVPTSANVRSQGAADPVAQGKFVTESGEADNGEEERIAQLLRTFMEWKRDDMDMTALYDPILRDFEANRTKNESVSLTGWMAKHSGALTAAEEMLRTRSTGEPQGGMEIEGDAKVLPQKRKRKESAGRSDNKKRKLDVDVKPKKTIYSSDVEESSDDETTELDAKQKLQILMNLTASNMDILRSAFLESTKDEHRFDEPLHRKIYSADRSSNVPKIADLSTQDYFYIGEQRLRIGDSTGHFIQAGGNAETRGKTIKEPPPDYDKLVEAMLNMAKDPSAASLYKLATGADLDDKEKFEDRELAAIMLYYLNHNVSKSHTVRSNLTEHLQKFVSVVGISELTRSFEAGGSSSYSAETLVKMMLKCVIDGTVSSLQAVFYEGNGGMDSLFLGAPSAERSKDGLGGATVLRNPFAYEENLERQMSPTPHNKKAFKALLNAVSSGSKTELKPIDEKEKARLREDKQARQLKVVRRLIQTIQKTKMPKSVFALNDFLNDANGTLGKLSKRLKGYTKTYADNPEALALIRKGWKALAAKKREAQNIKF
ncbi:hypothetical protein [Cohnella sp. GbtcB17]|uniref:hypothetical protein n=1 Tax=Cohnella sp. GbtcB17 TaxID=2824762 RepID=UPI001C30741A|nr:hypothetical protein [Cohnella sp. GbtcB17]